MYTVCIYIYIYIKLLAIFHCKSRDVYPHHCWIIPLSSHYIPVIFPVLLGNITRNGFQMVPMFPTAQVTKSFPPPMPQSIGKVLQWRPTTNGGLSGIQALSGIASQAGRYIMFNNIYLNSHNVFIIDHKPLHIIIHDI